MFHLDLEGQARTVKTNAASEWRGNFDHDNVIARYMWGRKSYSGYFSNFDKKSRYGDYDLLFGGDKNLFLRLVGSANGWLIYFVAMLSADGGEINAVKDEA